MKTFEVPTRDQVNPQTQEILTTYKKASVWFLTFMPPSDIPVML